MSFIGQPPILGYQPPGPVAARYIIDERLVVGIVGPQGSGKTGASINKILYRAMRQAPHPVTRVRQTRWLVVREKAVDLKDTVIKSWHSWVPEEFGKWKWGGSGEPASHHLMLDLPDGTVVDCEVIFIGLDDEGIERKLKGREITGVYVNEGDQLSKNAFKWLRGRIGRFPKRDNAVGFKGASWKGIWFDFNMTDDLHWIYQDFVEKQYGRYGLHIQPGAMIETPARSGNFVLNPRAENLDNLPDGYYEDQIEGQDRWWILRNVCNKWGASRNGEPVYPEFDEEFHLAPRMLDPVPGLTLRLGLDAGLMAGGTVNQEMPNGQLRTIDEVIAPEGGWGAVRCGEDVLRLLSGERYAAWRQSMGRDWKKHVEVWGDPAAGARSAVDAEERTWLQMFRATTGFAIRPAPTNDPGLRQEAVRVTLTRVIDGQPGYWISPHCKVVRRGFTSGYCLKVTQTEHGRTVSEAVKNQYSHPHDGHQYACVGAGEHLEALGRRKNRGQSDRVQTEAITEDNPSGGWAGGERQAYADFD